MLKRNIVISSILLSLIGFSGCSVKTGNSNLENMSQTHIKKEIIKGKTTKDEIRKMLGEPFNTSILMNGDESWTYMFSKSKSSFFVPATSSSGKTLFIIFDKNGIVKNYSFSKTHQGGVKIGF
jgi:outer membrane protein assembly factor BamE (lipoprotein component of BamABCDE complex)